MSSESRRAGRALNRRDFIKVGGGCVAGAAAMPALGTGAVTESTTASASVTAYPVVDVARLADLAPGASVAFNYPDASSPALLLRLHESAADGVGDDSSVVAYSILCTHKGCPVSWKAERGMLICPCHWSTFDPAKGGSIVIGQASESLPRIELEVHDGTVRAVGVSGLIFGRHTNIL